jgi:endonuclease G, mitochondrial
MPRHLRVAAHALLAAFFLSMAATVPARSQHPQNKPDFCKSIWEEIGTPEGRPGSKTTIVCHLGYIVGHNDSKKTPNWVIERLTPDLTKSGGSREGKDFAADPMLPEAAQAKPTDYDPHGSEFDKGHNAPAADFSGKQDFLDDTFFYSNAVPQVGAGFNRSIWRSLETQVRNLVGSNHAVMYVITGPVYQSTKAIKITNDVCRTEMELPVVEPTSICPENAKNKEAACAAVPAAMYKIVYDPVMQNAFAVLLQNKSHTGLYKSGKGGDYIQAHRVGLATVEDLTGLTFFTKFTARKLRQMRSSCVDVKVH